MPFETFKVGDLTAVVGDNAAHEGRRAGYNGLWSLTHRTRPDASAFAIAGLNFEHIFDGEKDQLNLAGDRRIFFEPRNHPMELRRVSDVEAELHQTPTPTYHVESWTRFRFAEPHAIDMTFRCVPRQHAFRHGYAGFFWASYMNAPENKAIYFKGPRHWHQFCTQEHNHASTVRHADDRLELRFADVPDTCLYRNLSPLRYAEPFYYGWIGTTHLFVLMFDRTDGIRFVHSPTGGGPDNPAWDFQYTVPRVEVLQEYGFRARAVYRERCSRDEIEREVRDWRASLPK